MYQNQPNLGKYMDTVGYCYSCDDLMTMIIIIKFPHREFVDNLQVSRMLFNVGAIHSSYNHTVDDRNPAPPEIYIKPYKKRDEQKLPLGFLWGFRMVINPTGGVYIPMDQGFPSKGGMTIPKKRKLRPCQPWELRKFLQEKVVVSKNKGIKMYDICSVKLLTIKYSMKTICTQSLPDSCTCGRIFGSLTVFDFRPSICVS